MGLNRARGRKYLFKLRKQRAGGSEQKRYG